MIAAIIIVAVVKSAMMVDTETEIQVETQRWEWERAGQRPGKLAGSVWRDTSQRHTLPWASLCPSGKWVECASPNHAPKCPQSKVLEARAGGPSLKLSQEGLLPHLLPCRAPWEEKPLTCWSCSHKLGLGA